jgi:Plasmid pRiA4b ORF-3-like protein
MYDTFHVTSVGMSDAGFILALKISLVDVEPAVWRRLLVPYDISLSRFHKIIQCAVGWQNQHLYEFKQHQSRRRARGAGYNVFQPPTKFTRSTLLKDAIGMGGKRILYIYDMGDYWVHEIVVEEVLRNDMGEPVLRCVAGAGQCPPEDVGGAPGYEEFLKAIADPAHEAHSHYFDWAGGTFDPTRFDIEEINRGLSRIKSRLGTSKTASRKQPN